MQPGIVLDELRDAAGKHGLTFGPDPATHSRNTLGGMIGNNSCGIHSMMAGRDRRQHRGAGHRALRRHADDGRARPTTRNSKRIIAEGGRKGEIYRRLESSARSATRTRFARSSR